MKDILRNQNFYFVPSTTTIFDVRSTLYQAGKYGKVYSLSHHCLVGKITKRSRSRWTKLGASKRSRKVNRNNVDGTWRSVDGADRCSNKQDPRGHAMSRLWMNNESHWRGCMLSGWTYTNACGIPALRTSVRRLPASISSCNLLSSPSLSS